MPSNSNGDFRLHRWLVVIGVAAGATLTTGMLALFERTDGETTPASGPPVAMTTPATPSPSPTATPSKKKEKKDKEKAAEPEKRHKPASRRGRLSVDDEGCRGVRTIVLPRTCRVRLTAKGGSVDWSVSSVRSKRGRISVDGGGKLASGRSTSVAVTVRPTVSCFVGGRASGTVSFSPGGDATVTYTCWRH